MNKGELTSVSQLTVETNRSVMRKMRGERRRKEEKRGVKRGRGMRRSTLSLSLADENEWTDKVSI